MLVNSRILARSGIKIKPENRGKFTASAKRAGRGVQEHARAVLNNPNATALQKKRANFARNAAKWKKEDGGKLDGQSDRIRPSDQVNTYGEPIKPTDKRMPHSMGIANAYMDVIRERLDASNVPASDATRVDTRTFEDVERYLPNQYQDFIAEWLNNRKQQFTDNVYHSSEPGLFDFESGLTAQRMLDKQKNNLYTVAETKEKPWFADPTTTGFYKPSAHELWIRPGLDEYEDAVVRVHELSHALNTKDVQGEAIKRILSETPNTHDIPAEIKANEDYLYDPEEIYSRMMEMRYSLGMDPNVEVTDEDLDSYRENYWGGGEELLRMFDNNILKKLFNKVAHNEAADTGVPKARNGGKMARKKRLVALNDLHPFRYGGGMRKKKMMNDGGDLTFRPTEGAENATGTPLITREQMDRFRNDPTDIPGMRQVVSDAMWRNILGEFENPNVEALGIGNIPGMSGEQITGRFHSTPEELSPVFGGANVDPFLPDEINFDERPTSRKVNAYNYGQGRPFNRLERLVRGLRFGGKGYQEGGLLNKAQDRNLTLTNRLDTLDNNELDTEIRSLSKTLEGNKYAIGLDERFPQDAPSSMRLSSNDSTSIANHLVDALRELELRKTNPSGRKERGITTRRYGGKSKIK